MNGVWQISHLKHCCLVGEHLPEVRQKSKDCMLIASQNVSLGNRDVFMDFGLYHAEGSVQVRLTLLNS